MRFKVVLTLRTGNKPNLCGIHIQAFIFNKRVLPENKVGQWERISGCMIFKVRIHLKIGIFSTFLKFSCY